MVNSPTTCRKPLGLFPDRPEPRLYDRVVAELRTRHYSRRTEEAYVGWIRRFIQFHQRRHAAQMGEREIAAFLSHLAVERNVSASTQNQALAALLFLYQQVLGGQLDWLDDLVRANRPERLPVRLRPQRTSNVATRLRRRPLTRKRISLEPRQ